MSKVGLIGTKMGMTREFLNSENQFQSPWLSLKKGRIIHLIDKTKRGYDAIQVGFGKIKKFKA